MTKTYDFLNRLTSIRSINSQPSTISSHEYQYNQANQRTRATLTDGSYWLYEYDSLGQVRSGKKYWSDGTPVTGQQFEYGFDDIGNRKSTKSGGDENGWNLRSANCTNNGLNQITGRDTPGAVDIMGLSFATNSVTVNSQTAYRKGEYFRKELAVGNGSASLWTNMIVAATGQTSVTGNVFVAKTPEAFTYDSDGNLTSDGRWTNRWDGENRLIAMETLSAVPTGGKKALGFSYDARGRRQSLVVSNWSGSAWTNVTAQTRRLVYDTWNLLAALDGNNALVQSFVWALDLSGSPQGACGVGGLLAMNDAGNGLHFAAYDGNGNVRALVKGSDGTVSANYEYGPFGEALRRTGPMAKANPFRFSTKYQDDDTDLLYYGYRFYNPSVGRWLSRDPLEEDGGENLYGFLHDDAVNTFDLLGLYENSCCDKCHINYYKMALFKRYGYAKAYLDPHAPSRPFDIESTWSCFNLAKNILLFMAPTPPCWKCHVENRKKKIFIPFVGWRIYDENSIICSSQPKPGLGAPETLVFDYYQQWTGVSYATFTGAFPIPGYVGDNARSESCLQIGPHHWGNYAYLDNIIYPAGHK